MTNKDNEDLKMFVFSFICICLFALVLFVLHYITY